jgi:hypothetical protein
MRSPFRNCARMAVLHGYRHPLLWPTPGTAMLLSYAQVSVYLNIGGLHGLCLGDRVQVGRRDWRRPLQRSATRECREGAVEGAADLYGSQDSGATATTGQAGAQARLRLSELRNLRADKRPGVHEHVRGHCGRDGTTHGTTGRHRSRNTRRPARSGRAGQWRPVHHLTGGQRYTLDSDDSSGSVRRDLVFITRRDLPRNTTFAAVTDPANPTTLTAPRDASSRGTRRCRGRRGR